LILIFVLFITYCSSGQMFRLPATIIRLTAEGIVSAGNYQYYFNTNNILYVLSYRPDTINWSSLTAGINNTRDLLLYRRNDDGSWSEASEVVKTDYVDLSNNNSSDRLNYSTKKDKVMQFKDTVVMILSNIYTAPENASEQYYYNSIVVFTPLGDGTYREKYYEPSDKKIKHNYFGVSDTLKLTRIK
jgi:hypothetical protein